jgi:hypothetical protein
MSGGGDRPASGAGGTVKTPSDFLKSIRGRPVVVKLNSGVDYRGHLQPSALFPPLSPTSITMFQTLLEEQSCLLNYFYSY